MLSPESHIAVSTGFGQLFRGMGKSSRDLYFVVGFDDSPIGQVGGVAISSALFQSRLDSELRARIRTPDADEVGSAISGTIFRALTRFDHR